MHQKSIGYNSVSIGTTGFYTKLNRVKPPYTFIDSCRIKTEVILKNYISSQNFSELQIPMPSILQFSQVDLLKYCFLLS